ncbi:MAG TPA: VCBS repeat-containing protein, partial [Pyrinomonadaceae bacterium]
MKRKTSGPSIRVPALLCLFLACATAVVSVVSSEGPRPSASAPPVHVFAVGSGAHSFRFNLGRDTQSMYVGAASLKRTLEDGSARPLGMAAEDFNGDGKPDLLIGYATRNGTGLVSLRLGNTEAVAPRSQEVLEGIRQGRYPSPFLTKASLFELPGPPDFLLAGDFNADGHPDVLASTRGGNSLYLLAGDGRGGFVPAKQLAVQGSVTALASGEINLNDGLTDLFVGVVSNEGPKALAFEGGRGGLRAQPAVYDLPGQANAFASGSLDDDGASDLAVAAGSELVIIHGREDSRAEKGAAGPKTEGSPSNRIERADFPFYVSALATGDFIFDREHLTELALLAPDGTVYLVARGDEDRRPYTKDELETIQRQRIEVRRGRQGEETLTALLKGMVRRGKKRGWVTGDTLYTGATPPQGAAPQGFLKAARVSGRPLDDLLVCDAVGRRAKVVQNVSDERKLQAVRGEALPDPPSQTVEADGEPLAVLAMNLSPETKTDFVVLNSDRVEPSVSILLPDSTYTVNTTSDT